MSDVDELAERLQAYAKDSSRVSDEVLTMREAAAILKLQAKRIAAFETERDILSHELAVERGETLALRLRIAELETQEYKDYKEAWDAAEKRGFLRGRDNGVALAEKFDTEDAWHEGYQRGDLVGFDRGLEAACQKIEDWGRIDGYKEELLAEIRRTSAAICGGGKIVK